MQHTKCVQLQHTPNQATRMQHCMPVRVQQITPKGNHYATTTAKGKQHAIVHARTAAKHAKRQLECNTARAYSCKLRQKASNMQLCTRVQQQSTAKGKQYAIVHARTAAKHGKRQVICNCARAYSCKTRQKASNMQLFTRVQLQTMPKGK